MKTSRDKIAAFIWFMVLLTMSFFKDDFTPDYLNTSSASFLDPANNNVSRISTLTTHYSFWIVSILYSLVFVLFPYLIIQLYFNNKTLSRFVLIVHLAMLTITYLLIFLNNTTIDKAIVPKLNRYYHSPILLLFFIAAFTLSQHSHDKKQL